MEYLVAVLSDRQQAEAAYSALAEQNLPMEQVSLLGEGHESADEFGLIEPNLQAKKQSSRLAYWVIPFGFAAGYAFNVLTQIALVGNGGIFDHIFGGILGAASAALGSVLVGGAVGWTTGSGDALAYRNRLNAGKYLIIAKGTDTLVRQATRTLRQFEPENIQGYTEPASSPQT